MRHFKILAGLIFLTLATTACHDPNGPPTCTGQETVTPATGAPTVMVIGDSISIGYTPTVRAGLPTRDVVHNPCNAMDSIWTSQHIDQWLDSRPSFEAITWNNGLWDVASWAPTPDAQYEANLHFIAQKIKAKTSKPLFVLSSEVLPGTAYRNDADVQAKNAIAVAVMALEGIPVLDLHAVSATIQADHVTPTDAHFTDAGYAVLGSAVLNQLSLMGVN